ncbi:hypothetical protein GCM10010372_82310 [Streptomyces tauricus]|nr:hypothetical protein GCM10010372_82310 [Streptomyces tauricus]
MWTSHDPPGEDLDDIPPEKILSQYGTAWFKDRPEGYWALSLWEGPLTADDATRRVARRQATPSDRVRHTTAARLREAGFCVFSSRHTGHVSVMLKGATSPWPDAAAAAFDECFATSREEDL